MSGAGVRAGEVGRAHGLDGGFYLNRATARLLAVGMTVHVGGETLEILRLAGLPARPIVHLAGVGDRAAAEALRGLDVTVEVEDVRSLQDGEWWAYELEGCEVYDGSRHLGSVTRMLELPSCEVLEVRREQGRGPLLVPMVKDAVRTIDVAQGHIDIDTAFLGEPSS